MYNEVKKVLKDEIKYYTGKENEDWTSEKNEGFKEGIKYSYDLINRMESKECKDH